MTFIQDPVTPLAPSAPYTPISAVHPGVASLHSSPHHPSRSPYGGSPATKRPLGYASPGRRQDIDMRAELEKHKSSLTLDDWQVCSKRRQNNGLFASSFVGVDSIFLSLLCWWCWDLFYLQKGRHTKYWVKMNNNWNPQVPLQQGLKG